MAKMKLLAHHIWLACQWLDISPLVTHERLQAMAGQP